MKKVMIVDDSDLVRIQITSFLEGLNCEIIEAENGIEAVSMYKDTKPDLITLDITMPGLNGQEVLERILKINPDAIVIMLTALDQRALIMDCLKMGAKAYLVKPLNKDEFMETMKKFL